jgi:hypothetical protein
LELRDLVFCGFLNMWHLRESRGASRSACMLVRTDMSTTHITGYSNKGPVRVEGTKSTCMHVKRTHGNWFAHYCGDVARTWKDVGDERRGEAEDVLEFLPHRLEKVPGQLPICGTYRMYMSLLRASKLHN